MDTPQVIFISGTGRSGTNITKAIFSKHDQCGALPFEYRFTVDPGGLVDFVNNFSSFWSPYIADKKIKDLESFLISLGDRDEWEYTQSQWLKEIDKSGKKLSSYPYSDWELEKWMPGYNNFVHTLIAQIVDYKYSGVWPGTKAKTKENEMYFSSRKSKKELMPLFSDFLNKCFTSFLGAQKKSIMVEDNTWSILAADDLLEMVPQGKLLHIIRDPRDVIASLVNQRWCPTDLDHLISWYSEIMMQWESKKSLLSDNQYLEIKLEDIVSDTETTLQKMCAFVEIDYQSSMNTIDLTKSNTGRYKDQFSADEVATIESRLKDIMSQYGY